MKSTSRDTFTSQQSLVLFPGWKEKPAQGSGVCPETLPTFPLLTTQEQRFLFWAPLCSMRNFSDQGLNLCFLQWNHEVLTAGLSRKLESRYFFPRILSKPCETNPIGAEQQRLAGCLRAGWREPSPAPGYQGPGLGTTTERVTDSSSLSNAGALTLHPSRSLSSPHSQATQRRPLLLCGKQDRNVPRLESTCLSVWRDAGSPVKAVGGLEPLLEYLSATLGAGLGLHLCWLMEPVTQGWAEKCRRQFCQKEGRLPQHS